VHTNGASIHVSSLGGLGGGSPSGSADGLDKGGLVPICGVGIGPCKSGRGRALDGDSGALKKGGGGDVCMSSGDVLGGIPVGGDVLGNILSTD
jgi:hypothetical protein